MDRIKSTTKAGLAPLVVRNVWQTLTDLPKVRKRRLRQTEWARPNDEEIRRYGMYADNRADFFHGIAHVGEATWLIYERAWAGYPDPPLYVCVFLAADDTVIAASDCNTLPSKWVFLTDTQT